MKDFAELRNDLLTRMPGLAPSGDQFSEGFADIVFSYRIRSGLTQQQLAEKSNVSIKSIQRIEGGSGGVSNITYKSVLRSLNIDYEEALDFIKKKNASKG